MRAVFQILDDLPARFASEHQQIQQRIAAQTIRAMHRHAGALAHRIKALHHFLRPGFIGRYYLAVIIGGNAAHHVMRCGHDRDRLLDRIDVGEFDGDFADARQTLVDHFLAQMIQLEQDR